MGADPRKMGWSTSCARRQGREIFPQGHQGHDLSGCRDNLVDLPRSRSAMVRQVPLASDVTPALPESDRNKALAVAAGAEDDLVAVF